MAVESKVAKCLAVRYNCGHSQSVSAMANEGLRTLFGGFLSDSILPQPSEKPAAWQPVRESLNKL